MQIEISDNFPLIFQLRRTICDAGRVGGAQKDPSDVSRVFIGAAHSAVTRISHAETTRHIHTQGPLAKDEKKYPVSILRSSLCVEMALARALSV